MNMWSLYEYQPSFMLGFHGCDKQVGESLLDGSETHLMKSEKEYDWLGHGIYFWEGNPTRALEWAHQRKAQGKIQEPFVIGAVIGLGHCLDLFDQSALNEVRDAYLQLKKTFRKSGKTLPENVGKKPDRVGRKLDCMVLNYLHQYRELSNLEPYDSIRGPFLEGKPLYRKAGFRTNNHIQLCVRSISTIKGYFRPIVP
jgi:hypothetical protein